MLSFWATTLSEEVWEKPFSEINEIPVLLFLTQANQPFL